MHDKGDTHPMTFEQWRETNNISGNFKQALLHQILADHGGYLATDLDSLTEDDYAASWNTVLSHALSAAATSSTAPKLTDEPQARCANSEVHAL